MAEANNSPKRLEQQPQRLFFAIILPSCSWKCRSIVVASLPLYFTLF